MPVDTEQVSYLLSINWHGGQLGVLLKGVSRSAIIADWSSGVFDETRHIIRVLGLDSDRQTPWTGEGPGVCPRKKVTKELA